MAPWHWMSRVAALHASYRHLLRSLYQGNDRALHVAKPPATGRGCKSVAFENYLRYLYSFGMHPQPGNSPMKIYCFLLITIFTRTPAFAQERSSIYKCIIAGKTTYSDNVCGKPGSNAALEIHHARGIVSPDRQTVADTRARIQDQMWVDEEPGRERTRTITRNGVANTFTVSNRTGPAAVVMPLNVERCNQAGQTLQDLDAMARKPQSGQMQDWIKSEKIKVQAQSAALNC